MASSNQTKSELSLDHDLPASVQERAASAIEAAQAAGSTQKAAEAARTRTDNTTDPAEKESAEREATALEKKAKGQLRLANQLQSGAWQGAGAGAGIGMGTGMGLGTVVGTVTGTLVGGLTAIPTTLVGGLAGAVTGAIHGPWASLSEMHGKDKESGDEREEEGTARQDHESCSRGPRSIPN